MAQVPVNYMAALVVGVMVMRMAFELVQVKRPSLALVTGMLEILQTIGKKQALYIETHFQGG